MSTHLNSPRLLEVAFTRLFGDREQPRFHITYSGKLKPYNANVHIDSQFGRIYSLHFKLSKSFFEVGEDIQIGIVQELLNKVYKTRINTIEQDLYNSFVKQLSKYTPAKKSDTLLVELFAELNDEYFSGLLEQPTLVFGTESIRTMGHYTFAQDKITISTILRNERELCKFVVYHELLHKKHHYQKKNGRMISHSKVFRQDELKYHDVDIEKKLQQFVRKYRYQTKKQTREMQKHKLKTTYKKQQQTKEMNKDTNDSSKQSRSKNIIQQLIDAFLD